MFRFPNGDFEYDISPHPCPLIGEKLRRKGVLWLVTRITHEIVHVARAEARKSK